MIIHYLKVAIRNLLKYKTQSIISIVGLAIGFACFALANLWIHYEMTYDCQFDGADRFYQNALSNIEYLEEKLSRSGRCLCVYDMG